MLLTGTYHILDQTIYRNSENPSFGPQTHGLLIVSFLHALNLQTLWFRLEGYVGFKLPVVVIFGFFLLVCGFSYYFFHKNIPGNYSKWISMLVATLFILTSFCLAFMK